MRDDKVLTNFLKSIGASTIAEANLTDAQAEALRQLGYKQQVDERMAVIATAEKSPSSFGGLDGKFYDEFETVRTPPKIGPDELGNAETRGHRLVEPSETVEEPTVEIDFENDDCVVVVGPDKVGNAETRGHQLADKKDEKEELDAIPTRPAARLPASPDEPTLRELELSDFKEEEAVNVGTTPPPVPVPQPHLTLQPPADLLGNSWSQEAPTTPRAPALQQKRRCFKANLNDIVLVLGATVMTVMLGTTFYELGRSRERSFWQKLFAERPVIEKKCGGPEPVVVYLDRQPPSQPDARAAAAAAPVQKPQPKIGRPAQVARRLPSPPPRPLEVEVVAVMGTYPLPPAGDSRESVLATLKRACGSDPRWIDANRSLLLGPAATTIRTVCRSNVASKLPNFAPIKDFPAFTLKIRQS